MRHLLGRIAQGLARLRSRALELFAEGGAIILGYPEQVGDDQQCERSRELGDELALAVVDELVDLAIGEAPHEVLVLPQPLGRDEAHEEASVLGVLGRVHARQLVAEGQFVAVLLDQIADVVAFEGDREAGEGPRCLGGRGEPLGIRVDGPALLEPGHHHHVVVLLGPHGALGAQPVEVGVRVAVERPVGEEVDRVEVGHGRPVASCPPARSGSWTVRYNAGFRPRRTVREGPRRAAAAAPTIPTPASSAIPMPRTCPRPGARSSRSRTPTGRRQGTRRNSTRR